MTLKKAFPNWKNYTIRFSKLKLYLIFFLENKYLLISKALTN